MPTESSSADTRPLYTLEVPSEIRISGPNYVEEPTPEQIDRQINNLNEEISGLTLPYYRGFKTIAQQAYQQSLFEEITPKRLFEKPKSTRLLRTIWSSEESPHLYYSRNRLDFLVTPSELDSLEFTPQFFSNSFSEHETYQPFAHLDLEFSGEDRPIASILFERLNQRASAKNDIAGIFGETSAVLQFFREFITKYEGYDISNLKLLINLKDNLTLSAKTKVRMFETKTPSFIFSYNPLLHILERPLNAKDVSAFKVEHASSDKYFQLLEFQELMLGLLQALPIIK